MIAYNSLLATSKTTRQLCQPESFLWKKHILNPINLKRPAIFIRMLVPLHCNRIIMKLMEGIQKKISLCGVLYEAFLSNNGAVLGRLMNDRVLLTPNQTINVITKYPVNDYTDVSKSFQLTCKDCVTYKNFLGVPWFLDYIRYCIETKNDFGHTFNIAPLLIYITEISRPRLDRSALRDIRNAYKNFTINFVEISFLLSNFALAFNIFVLSNETIDRIFGVETARPSFGCVVVSTIADGVDAA